MWQLAFFGYVALFVVGVLACTIAVSGIHALLTGDMHLLSSASHDASTYDVSEAI